MCSYLLRKVNHVLSIQLGLQRVYEYCVCLQLVYSSGRLIDALLGAAAQNYLEFKLLQQRCLILTPDTIDSAHAWDAGLGARLLHTCVRCG